MACYLDFYGLTRCRGFSLFQAFAADVSIVGIGTAVPAVLDGDDADHVNCQCDDF